MNLIPDLSFLKFPTFLTMKQLSLIGQNGQNLEKNVFPKPFGWTHSYQRQGCAQPYEVRK